MFLRQKHVLKFSVLSFRIIDSNNFRDIHTTYFNLLRKTPSIKRKNLREKIELLDELPNNNTLNELCSPTNKNFYGIENDHGVIVVDGSHSVSLNDHLSSSNDERPSGDVEENFYNMKFGIVRRDSDNKLEYHGQYENKINPVFPSKSVKFSSKVNRPVKNVISEIKSGNDMNSYKNLTAETFNNFSPQGFYGSSNLKVPNEAQIDHQYVDKSIETSNSKNDSRFTDENSSYVDTSQAASVNTLQNHENCPNVNENGLNFIDECYFQNTRNYQQVQIPTTVNEKGSLNFIDENYFHNNFQRDDDGMNVSENNLKFDHVDSLVHKISSNNYEHDYKDSNEYHLSCNNSYDFKDTECETKSILDSKKRTSSDNQNFDSIDKNKSIEGLDEHFAKVNNYTNFKGGPSCSSLDTDILQNDTYKSMGDIASGNLECIPLSKNALNYEKFICNVINKASELPEIAGRSSDITQEYELENKSNKLLRNNFTLETKSLEKFAVISSLKQTITPTVKSESSEVKFQNKSNFMPSSDIKLNQNGEIKTAYDFVNRIREEKATTYHELKEGITSSKEILDHKGFRILKNQVPILSHYTQEEILSLLVNSVLYSDDDLIILNKPYNLVLHDSQSTIRDICLSTFLNDLAKELDRSNSAPQLFTVHRLDKETTGCLLLARNELSAQNLKSLFAQRKIQKTYWVVTTYVPDPREGIIDIPIAEGSVGNKARMVLQPEIPDDINYKIHCRNGKRAVTRYKVLAESGNAALVEVKPETGVKHQIRVHFGFGLSCPILGDHKYSHLTKLAPQKLPSDMLQRLHIRQSKVRYVPMHIHARSIVIPEHLCGRDLFVMAPLPEHMKKNLKSLKFRKMKS